MNAPTAVDALVAFSILAASTLYSSVGQAGGSGYLAVMAFVGLPPEQMRPTALTLNVLVAGIGTLRFAQAGSLAWSALWPFLLGSIPMAFAGGLVQLPREVYNPVIGGILIVAAWPLLRRKPSGGVAAGAARPGVPLLPAIGAGAATGLLAGLTGMGGGAFLSPLLLLAGWATPRQMAGISTGFILLNSLAALAGTVAGTWRLPDEVVVWGAAAVVGGLIGAELGSRHLSDTALRRLLAAVLIAAGAKLILT